jgi:fucose permease
MSDAAAPAGHIPDRGPAVFAVTTATLVVGTAFFIARLFCRSLIVKRVSWDDYFIILAWFLAAGLSTTIDIGTSKGLGRHDADIAGQDRLALRKTEYVFSVLYNPALMALKTSVLIFYLRLSKNTQQVLRIASWVVLGIVNTAGVVLTFLNIFQCNPVIAAFSLYRYQAQCIPLLTEFICSAPVNIVTDLAILALPIPVLTGMRLPKRQKYILVLTFSLGIFVTIVDVVRIYYLQQAISFVPTAPSNDPGALFGDSPQFAWNASLSLMWSAVEVNVGMICACIPTLKPLILKILPSVLFDPDGTHNSSLSTYATDTQDKEPSGSQIASGPAHSAEAPEPAAPPSQARPRDSSVEHISALDFLTTPDMLNPASPNSAPPAQPLSPTRRNTWMSGRSRNDNALYFGFVNMRRPKSMIKTAPAESLRYCVVVTILFLVWGFSYGLLNTLNNVIATVSNMSTAETLGLTSAYFGGGYLFGPLVVGEWVLRHDEHARFHRHRRRHKHRDAVGGFKATFILGLCIYGIGTIMFWPCAVLTSFPGFMISNFVVGFGLGVLETAANPFIILCGPQQYAETRILIAQGFQGVASVISGLLAQKVFFDDIAGSYGRPTSLELIDVQWTYLAITLSCVALALFFYYMPLPEVTDAELGRAADRLPVDAKKRTIGGLQLRTLCIILAVMAQWFYVAAQESMSIFFDDLMNSALPGPSDADQPPGLVLSVSDYLLIAHAAFTVSRFNSAHLAWLSAKHPQRRLVPTPRTQLTICTALSVVFALVCVVLRPANPNFIAIPAILFFFVEGPIWPLIFAMGLRGQGNRTKRASAWLTMGASGPAFWPFVMYGIMSNKGVGVHLAFVVPVILLVFTLAYPIFLTVLKDAKDLVDPRAPRGRRASAGGGLGGGEHPESGSSTRDTSTTMDEILRHRRMSTATASSAQRDSGPLAFVVGKIHDFNEKRREKKRQNSSTTTSSSPMWEHFELRRESDGGQSGNGRGRQRGNSTPTIPEER